MNWFENYPEDLKERIASGEIINQKYWSFIRELNSFSEERLDTTAIIDGEKKLTYRQMFRKWEDFAGIFSALGITEGKKARIGLMSSLGLDCINMIYAANMTGASVAMIHAVDVVDQERFERAVELEGITDLILVSDVISPVVLKRILSSRKKLSLNNVIVYYYRLSDDRHIQRREDRKYMALKRVEGALFLDDLQDEYPGTPIQYASEEPKEDAIVFLTSGTTSGVHKPVPLSDSAFNEAAARLLRDERFNSLESVITLMQMDPMMAYAACDMLHLPLSYGGTIVLMKSGLMDPSALKVIEDQKISVMFSGAVVFEMLVKFSLKADLSSVQLVFLGGSYLPKEKKLRYMKYLRDCGSQAEIYIGYGLTEMGGAALLTDKNTENDYLGKPLSGVKVKILDEENGTYHDPEDGARIGVLCLSSKSLSLGRLNDRTLFELIDLDGEKYLNTYDLVEVNENGDMRVIGRMNKFFVNNDGVRFDAGLVETAISGEPEIVDCGLVPEYAKLMHDTIPVLYVKTRGSGRRARAIVKNALSNVFIRDDKITESNLPSRVVIVEELPYTLTGKVDVHRILKEKYTGDAYRIEPVRRNGKLIDIRLLEFKKEVGVMPGGVPDELAKDLELLKEVVELSGGRIKAPLGINPVKEMISSGNLAEMGAAPDMLCKLLKNGDIEPEMIGRIAARMMIDQEKQRREQRAKRLKKRREECRGCNRESSKGCRGCNRESSKGCRGCNRERRKVGRGCT